MNYKPKDINKWAQKAKEASQKAIAATAVQVYTQAIMDSPVDTGRFRNNWTVSINVPVYSDRPADKGGSGSLQSLITKWAPDIYITNSMPYAYKLEYLGWSKQAPQGTLRRAMAAFEPYLAVAVKYEL